MIYEREYLQCLIHILFSLVFFIGQRLKKTSQQCHVALHIDKTLHGLEASSGKENIVALKMKNTQSN
jgi:hypothetical protein